MHRRTLILICALLGVGIILIGYSIYENFYREKKYLNASYEELKKEYKLVNDSEAYEFINSMLNSSDTIINDIREHIKINCFTSEHGKEIREFLELQNDSILSKNDKEFMKSQFENKVYLWDQDRLRNVRCLTPKDLNEIEKRTDRDYWELFEELYGKYGRHKFSKPIFNEDKTKLIIEHEGSSGWEMGSGELYIFSKKNEKWYIDAKSTIWAR